MNYVLKSLEQCASQISFLPYILFMIVYINYLVLRTCFIMSSLHVFNNVHYIMGVAFKIPNVFELLVILLNHPYSFSD